jgi:hypothetical protein
VATPVALVATVAGLAGVVEPAPAVRVKVTLTPLTGLPAISRTRTLGGAATAVPAAADCVTTDTAAIDAAAPTPTVSVLLP